ncbi:hypothetical protein [Streptosporangium sp. NBC_01755]|uniref:hypothetical protein n=1 Tax=Streptosporangium sp. NBC_01755 TaxID=2975949 RepID=UPI002DDB495D|nr:hypothetical protein [Streptosporangium sp. NBC_01755]
MDIQNPDLLTPPVTGHGTVPNMKFSFSMAHIRIEEGGWTREVTARELPIATTPAGVDMYLNLREQNLGLRDIAARLVITKGKRKGRHPSPATVLRLLRERDEQPQMPTSTTG